MAVPTAEELIARALATMKTQKALGARLGRTREHVSRIAKGKRLSVSACLQLAEVVGEAPPVALRAYGYMAEADALERAYKAGHISGRERELLDDFARLEDGDREHLRALAKSLARRRSRKR